MQKNIFPDKILIQKYIACKKVLKNVAMYCIGVLPPSLSTKNTGNNRTEIRKKKGLPTQK